MSNGGHHPPIDHATRRTPPFAPRRHPPRTRDAPPPPGATTSPLLDPGSPTHSSPSVPGSSVSIEAPGLTCQRSVASGSRVFPPSRVSLPVRSPPVPPMSLSRSPLSLSGWASCSVASTDEACSPSFPPSHTWPREARVGGRVSPPTPRSWHKLAGGGREGADPRRAHSSSSSSPALPLPLPFGFPAFLSPSGQSRAR